MKCSFHWGKLVFPIAKIPFTKALVCHLWEGQIANNANPLKLLALCSLVEHAVVLVSGARLSKEKAQ